MALTPSNMLELGTVAPSFKLLDTISGNVYSFKDLKSKTATVVMFICNHCPFVIHVNEEIVKVANEYKAKGVSFIAISSNDVENYPQDSPVKMKVLAHQEGFTFPYLYDETQEVAKSYDAACTPDFYVFDGKDTLQYRGRLDDSRPGNDIPLTGKDLRDALDQVISGGQPTDNQHPSMGCNIKWKK